MSRREDIDTSVWVADPDFRRLPPDAKLVYFWSFTHGCNMAGIFKLDEGVVVNATGLSRRRLTSALEALESAQFILRHGQYVWVRSRVKHLRSTGPKMAKSIAGVIEDLKPTNPLRIAFLEKYRNKKWLREALTSIDGELATLEPNPETVSRTVRRPSMAGQGVVKDVGSTASSTENGKDYSRDFDDWLADHEQVTGMRPPGERTKARAAILESFTARRREDYSLDDLKLATRGAFADEHRRTNGYFGCLSVLRPQKVHDLVERGRRAAAGPLGATPTAADRGVTDMLEAARRLREEDAA